jgi:hypothetical protein
MALGPSLWRISFCSELADQHWPVETVVVAR